MKKRSHVEWRKMRMMSMEMIMIVDRKMRMRVKRGQ
jgi:hypothetical protein